MWDGEKITAPVSIEDVRQALGASSSDLGTLCTHPNINIWSRRKPVRSKKPYLGTGTTSAYSNAVDDTISYPEYLGDVYYDGISENYTINGGSYQVYPTFAVGFSVPMILKNSGESDTDFISRACTLIRAAKDTGMNWQPVKPRGSAYQEFYRLTDFNGYNSLARASFHSGLPGNKIFGNKFDVRFWVESSNGGINFADDLAYFLGDKGTPTKTGLWQLCVVITRADDYDPVVVAECDISGAGDDYTSVYRDTVEQYSQSINVYDFHVYQFVRHRDKSRIWFLPNPATSSYCATGFYNGAGTEGAASGGEDAPATRFGGIGNVEFSGMRGISRYKPSTGDEKVYISREYIGESPSACCGVCDDQLYIRMYVSNMAKNVTIPYSTFDKIYADVQMTRSTGGDDHDIYDPKVKVGIDYLMEEDIRGYNITGMDDLAPGQSVIVWLQIPIEGYTYLDYGEAAVGTARLYYQDSYTRVDLAVCPIAVVRRNDANTWDTLRNKSGDNALESERTL